MNSNYEDKYNNYREKYLYLQEISNSNISGGADVTGFFENLKKRVGNMVTADNNNTNTDNSAKTDIDTANSDINIYNCTIYNDILLSALTCVIKSRLHLAKLILLKINLNSVIFEVIFFSKIK